MQPHATVSWSPSYTYTDLLAPQLFSSTSFPSHSIGCNSPQFFVTATTIARHLQLTELHLIFTIVILSSRYPTCHSLPRANRRKCPSDPSFKPNRHNTLRRHQANNNNNSLYQHHHHLLLLNPSLNRNPRRLQTFPHNPPSLNHQLNQHQHLQRHQHHQQPPAEPGASPPEASIRPITPADITALRRLNSLLLPVSYPEAFYSRAADPVTGRFSRLICWSHHHNNTSSSSSSSHDDDPKPVGGIVCRVEPDIPLHAAAAAAEGTRPPAVQQQQQQQQHNIYIQSLCLLSPYRSLGLVAAALDDVLAAAIADPTLNVASVTAHVWTENEEGLHWYEARGFRKQEPAIKGYYLKLRPDSAWLVSKPVGASVLSALPGSTSSTSTSAASTSAASTSAASTSATPPPASSRADISGITAAVMSLPPMSTTTTTAAQGPLRPSARVASGKSFQNQRPETEWNDLPADMAPSLLVPPRNGSEPGSGASSRSSSTVRRKKDRAYPAAAFGQ